MSLRSAPGVHLFAGSVLKNRHALRPKTATPIQHRAEGTDRGGTLPPIRGAASSRKGQSDGCRRQQDRSRALADPAGSKRHPTRSFPTLGDAADNGGVMCDSATAIPLFVANLKMLFFVLPK